MVNITHAAKAAVAAYAAAVQMGGNTSVPSSDVASAMASFYLPSFTSFTLGQITVFPNETFATASINNILNLYNASGLGTDMRLARSRVEAVSDQAAFCFITWKIFPRNHIEPWEFIDVYGFRSAPNRTNGLLGGWELGNADHEYEELLARVPNFFGSMRFRRSW